jgi:hypothetical protein
VLGGGAGAAPPGFGLLWGLGGPRGGGGGGGGGVLCCCWRGWRVVWKLLLEHGHVRHASVLSPHCLHPPTQSISMDRQQKVLAKWEQHNRGQRRRAGPAPAAGGGSPAAAMRAWARVSRAARGALKKANPTVVMELEHQVGWRPLQGSTCLNNAARQSPHLPLESCSKQPPTHPPTHPLPPP